MRFVKKLIYGTLYLGILAAIGYGLYAANIFVSPTCFDNRQNQQEEELDCGGPSCIACAIKHLQPIRGSVEIFPTGANTNAVIFMANPNLNYGASSFNYTLNFYGANRQKIFSLTKNAYIYAAQAQAVLVEPNLFVNYAEISGAPELIIENPVWKTDAEFKSPKIQFRQVNTAISGTQAAITGILANREPFALAEASIGALASKKTSGARLGESKTILQDLQPFEERAFKITVPLSAVFKLGEIEPALFASARR